MSTKPRTPEYFPQMKVRGKRRRKLAPYQRMAGSFRSFGNVAAETARKITDLANSLN